MEPLFIFAGRAIRHKGDYATILLLDHRFLRPSIKEKLPTWISKSLAAIDRFGPAFAAIRKVSVNISVVLRASNKFTGHPRYIRHTSRVHVEGKSSVCLICMKYWIIILITIIISLGEILFSYIANTSRKHALMHAHTCMHAHVAVQVRWVVGGQA